ncbi:stage II sporulation protein M [Marine Group I thaumarchaeote]|nr:stage II sporulation protein M [Marine Group I thaumarchaeote]
MIFVLKMLNRIVLFFIFLGIFSASFAIGAEVQVSEEDSAIVLEEFESLIAEIDAVGIFVHNISLALPMFIPGFGIAWGAFAAFSTGMAFSVLQDANPMLENIPSLTILFMTPFGLMEIAAYSIAMSRSYMIVHKMIKRMSIRSDVRVIGLEVAILIGLLLAGGFIEYYFIQSIPIDMPKI